MASKRSKRRRRRGGIRWNWIAVIVFLVTVFVSTYAGPLTSLRIVRVIGVPSWDQDRVTQLLSGFQDKPAGLILRNQVESHVARERAVLGAVFSHNIFGRGRLSVSYRRAVARDADDPAYGWSVDGVRFRHHASSDLGLLLEVEESSLNFTFSSLTRAGDLLLLAQKMQVRLPNVEGTLAIEDSGGLFLTAPDGLRIRFGSVDGLNEKIDVLAGIGLETLETAAEINLVVPSRPTIR